MSTIDSPDYPGLISIHLGDQNSQPYLFAIEYGRKTYVRIYGCDCATNLTDEQARDMHAALTRYLRDRDSKADECPL